MKQKASFKLFVEYESDGEAEIDLAKRIEVLNKFLFNGLEMIRQESMLTPPDLSANHLSLESLGISKPY